MDDVQLSKLYCCTLSMVQRVYNKTLYKCATMVVSAICRVCVVFVSVKELTYLPASDAQQKTEDVRLLLFLKLLDIYHMH